MVSHDRYIIDLETLLVLIGLTDGNPEIQKLVAFENAFEILFVIIEQEGGVDGGIVVQDCLQLLANLLRYNSSNQVHYLQIQLI
jgi:intracellular protein transport protein USO1